MSDLSTVLTKEQIEKRVRELGQEITRDFQGKSIICVGVLKGSFVFLSDLIRNIQLPVSIDFLGASSYGQSLASSGVVKFNLDLSLPITDKHVILVEDIVDTGTTLHYLLESLRLRKPASLHLCALLLKPECLKQKVQIDYLGFKIENRFVVGYGLDAAEQHRNLPYLAAIPESEVRKD